MVGVEGPEMLVALTREISPSIVRCELTHLPRHAIDLGTARTQHGEYELALEEAGCEVQRLGADPDMPDSVFIEDAAVVVNELAIVTRPGAESRRRETPTVAKALEAYRPICFIDAPGTVDGGDVLVLGRRVYVGRSARTNDAGIAQIRAMLDGYEVVGVDVIGCLHLKSAVTAVGEGLLLINPRWVSRAAFAGCDFVDVDEGEHHAANALRIGDVVVYPTSFPKTAQQLERRGITLRMVDASELAKAEGAVTCCSLIFTSLARAEGVGV
jgi:dimethylargininase